MISKDPQHYVVELVRLVDRLKYGCGNHGCRVYEPQGMGTNATCQCYPRRLSRELLELAAEIEQIPQWERKK